MSACPRSDPQSARTRTVAIHLRIPLVLGATLGVALLTHQPVGAAAEPPSPGSGHAEVIAQGIVTFEAGPAHWRSTTNPATETEVELDTSAPTFIVSEGPDPVVVSGPTGPIARLAEGEALFRAGGESTLLGTSAATGGDAAAVSVVPGAGEPTLTFTPGPGARDVDLVRDVLSVNEVLLLHTDVSAFLAVTTGSITTGGTTLDAGSTAMLTGDLTLINTSPETAIVTVAVIGPLLSDSGLPAPPVTQPSGPSPTVAAPSPQAPTPATSPIDGTTPTTTTTTPADPDTDGDGLTDSEEADDGTDINNVDTDADGLNDAEEQQHGTDPLDSDTDNDELFDGYEINSAGSDPKRPDTDGDGIQDNVENATHTDPRIPDHDNDGDGLWSTLEGSIGTNPNNPDSDGDQLFDGYEKDRSFTDPLNADTDSDGVPDNVDHESCNANGADRDGDGLSDAEELNEYHTNCRLADTDGNGQNDPL